MVPDSGKRVVDHGVVPQVIGASRPVVISLIRRDPINRKAGVILGRNIRVEPAIILLVDNIGWIQRRIFGYVGDGVVQAASNSRLGRIFPPQILCAQRGGECNLYGGRSRTSSRGKGRCLRSGA